MMPRRPLKQSVVTDDVLRKVNPRNTRIVNLYLRRLEQKGNKSSAVKRKCDYNIFLCWNYLYNDNLLIPTLRKTQINAFFDWGIKQYGWGEARLHAMRSTIKGLLCFIEDFMSDEYPTFKNLIDRQQKNK